MKPYIPFTYYLFHRPTQRKYYGVRYAKGTTPADLWTKYFTSSKIVKSIIEEYGADSFDFVVRQTFALGAAAIEWEKRVLTSLKVVGREDWINGNVGGQPPSSRGKIVSEETKAKISKGQIGRVVSQATKDKITKTGKKQSVETIAKRISASRKTREIKIQLKKEQSYAWN